MKVRNEGKHGGGLGFLLGVATGAAAVLLYSAGRNRKLGDRVGDSIDSFEAKALEAKDKVAQRAADLRDTAKEKIHEGKEKIIGAIHKSTNGHDS